MTDARIILSTLKCEGEASCVGGIFPPHNMGKWPLLAWGVYHPTFGTKVFTQDQAASVEAIALDAATTPSYEALAAKHGTTAEHVRQAIEFALAAGFLSQGA